MLVLELLDEVIDETVIEVFSTKMGVTGGGLDLKNTLQLKVVVLGEGGCKCAWHDWHHVQWV